MTIRACAVLNDQLDRDRLAEVPAAFDRYTDELSRIWKEVFASLWVSQNKGWEWLPITGYRDRPTAELRDEGNWFRDGYLHEALPSSRP